MIMGTCLIPLALVIDNVFAQSFLALASIVLNIVAVVKSFKEKEKQS
ncbi:hypothetical protein SAMN02927903_02528 [Flavobacterium caeni]|uniref:Uncharacterized protein n=2 Tax=Flavobacterium caeni TaxID=490189 RepID=A0A1G5J5V8_9FLAO|nr:hypothetical protein SAMN02927903_02528 [Flavobacterium caeni]